jgi:hypothetical protein
MKFSRKIKVVACGSGRFNNVRLPQASRGFADKGQKGQGEEMRIKPESKNTDKSNGPFFSLYPLTFSSTHRVNGGEPRWQLYFF